MARLPYVTRDMVPEEFQEAYDEVTGGEVITVGPGSMTIYSPEMARRRAGLTAYLRYETTFPRRILELTIIATARAMDCPFIWNDHVTAARNEGVSDALINALRDKQPLPDISDDERAVINYINEFYTSHRVSPETFQAALDQFGPQHLVELTALMGSYAQTAFVLNAFEVELREGIDETVLPV